MTKDERKNPKLVKDSPSRKKRIADGSGKSLKDINGLYDALEQQKKAIKQMMNMSPEQMEQMKNNPDQIEPKAPKERHYKGKGKNRGRFRF